jgi:glycosyltransferase involved in cell wall biosynthesis
MQFVKRGLVTTIIPVYNRASMLSEAVQSVLQQNYEPIEIIIVDDGSTDSTPATAAAMARSDNRITVITKANGGAGSAREEGRRRASGEFVQHLDSDDLLLPGKFQTQVNALRSRSECGVAYGWTRLRAADGKVVPTPWKHSGEEIPGMFPLMLRSRWWDTPTPLYRSSLIAKAGPWLPLRIEEDWEYDCRIAAMDVRLAYCPVWVCEVRLHHEGHASGGKSSATKLHDRAIAHREIYGHARAGGISAASSEMQHFARELFLLARQCGAVGLSVEAKMMFDLAREASGPLGDRAAFRIYKAVAGILGWEMAGTLSCAVDRFRS